MVLKNSLERVVLPVEIGILGVHVQLVITSDTDTEDIQLKDTQTTLVQQVLPIVLGVHGVNLVLSIMCVCVFFAFFRIFPHFFWCVISGLLSFHQICISNSISCQSWTKYKSLSKKLHNNPNLLQQLVSIFFFIASLFVTCLL